jgi:hypothetical protein
MNLILSQPASVCTSNERALTTNELLTPPPVILPLSVALQAGHREGKQAVFKQLEAPG